MRKILIILATLLIAAPAVATDLTWEYQSSEEAKIIGYRVHYEDVSTHVNRSHNIAAPSARRMDDITTTLELETGHTYNIHMTAYNNTKESDPSESVLYTEGDSGGVLAIPAGVRLSQTIRLQAEDYDSKIDQGGKSWKRVEAAEYSGGAAMQALPSTGGGWDAWGDYSAKSPRMDYTLRFNFAGVYRIWIRGKAANVTSDSLHIGLDQEQVATAERIYGFGPDLAWTATTMDGNNAYLSIPVPGIYTLNVWMREDGLVIDQIIMQY